MDNKSSILQIRDDPIYEILFRLLITIAEFSEEKSLSSWFR